MAGLGAAWIEARCAPPVPTEYEVKAAYLCNFAEFVEWPGSDGKESAVTIGILGDDPFGTALEEIAKNRAVQTKTLAVKRLSRIDDALSCQIVYVSTSEGRNLAQILRSLATASVLTVSDIERFAEHGGIIGFTIEERRVRFEINLQAAERAGLRISSRLLKLARIARADSRSKS
jgi:hypothetical protein